MRREVEGSASGQVWRAWGGADAGDMGGDGRVREGVEGWLPMAKDEGGDGPLGGEAPRFVGVR